MKKNLTIFLILIIALILRLPALDINPLGLNADEAAIGYNAYSLLQTGKDEHGSSWPLVFRSFDDYKPGGYFYFVLPLVAILGLDIWAVRLPSAILGVISVYFIYLLVNELFPKSKLSDKSSIFSLGHLSALLLAVSPWHVHFSRGGWEVNAASSLMLIGLYLLFKSLKAPKFFIFATLLFVISLYTYHSLRLILPLVFIVFLTLYWQEIKKIISSSHNRRIIVSPIIIGSILLIPLILQFTSVEGRSRFSGVSVFADSGPLWEALELRREDQSDLRAKFIHNRYVTYGYRFVKNYLSHFSPRFLFVTGDEIARSKVPGVGQLFLITAPFFAFGLYMILRSLGREEKFVIAWLLLSPIASALTFQSPHALRSQNMIYPLSIIIAYGLSKAIQVVKERSRFLSAFFVLLISILITYETFRYAHQYYVHYPKELSYAWQFGFRQISDYVLPRYDKYDKIIISDRYDQPYILMAFFTKYSPAKLQTEIVMTPRDKFGFSTVKNFGRYEFKKIDWGTDSQIKNALIISADESVPEQFVIDRIVDPSGKSMYQILDTNRIIQK